MNNPGKKRFRVAPFQAAKDFVSDFKYYYGTDTVSKTGRFMRGTAEFLKKTVKFAKKHWPAVKHNLNPKGPNAKPIKWGAYIGAAVFMYNFLLYRNEVQQKDNIRNFIYNEMKKIDPDPEATKAVLKNISKGFTGGHSDEEKIISEVRAANREQGAFSPALTENKSEEIKINAQLCRAYWYCEIHKKLYGSEVKNKEYLATNYSSLQERGKLDYVAGEINTIVKDREYTEAKAEMCISDLAEITGKYSTVKYSVDANGIPRAELGSKSRALVVIVQAGEEIVGVGKALYNQARLMLK